MGGCATKPKVDNGNKTPAPVSAEVTAQDAVKDVTVATRVVEIVEEKKDGEVLRRPSLNHLLTNEVELTPEQEGKSVSEILDDNLEKVTQITELLKVEDLGEQVSTETIGTVDGSKSELAETEVTKLPAPQVVTPEVSKASETVTNVIAAAPETRAIETPKPSEVTKPEEVAPVVPKSEIPKLYEVAKTEESATEGSPKLGAPKPSEATQPEEVAPVVPKSEILKPSEITKTEEAVTEASPKLEAPKPSEATKPEEVAPVVPKPEIPKPSDVTKTEGAAAVLKSQIPQPSDVTKAKEAATPEPAALKPAESLST